MNNTKSVRPAISPLFNMGLGGLLSLLLAFGASGVAANDRVTLLWHDNNSGISYEVSSPSSALLSAVKKRVMAEIGLVPGAADDYEVQKSSGSGLIPVRDPNNPGQVIWVDAGETEVLDESQTLAELGIASGETLKLVQVATGFAGKGRGL
jgi:hypothetical protein